jgi:hypothetical protein
VLKEYGNAVAPKGNFLPTHSDVVVSVDRAKGKLTTIGGNVSIDTVGLKKWEIDPSGLLKKRNELICVLECRI